MQANFTIERPVRFADIDAAGWLYYPRFFEYCHNAFEDWINTKAPVGYPEAIDKQRWGFPAVKASGEYLAPLKHGDIAQVSIRILNVGNSSLKTGFEIIRKHDQTPSFKAEITTVCVNLDLGKSMPIPANMRAFLTQS